MCCFFSDISTSHDFGMKTYLPSWHGITMLGFWGIFQQNPPSNQSFPIFDKLCQTLFFLEVLTYDSEVELIVIPKCRVDSLLKRVPRRRDHPSNPMATLKNPYIYIYTHFEVLLTQTSLRQHFWHFFCSLPSCAIFALRCVFTGPLQGFLNALVYGSTPAVRDAITGRFDHGAAKLKGLKSQLRMLRKKRKNFQQFQEPSFWWRVKLGDVFVWSFLGKTEKWTKIVIMWNHFRICQTFHFGFFVHSSDSMVSDSPVLPNGIETLIWSSLAWEVQNPDTKKDCFDTDPASVGAKRHYKV